MNRVSQIRMPSRLLYFLGGAFLIGCIVYTFHSIRQFQLNRELLNSILAIIPIKKAIDREESTKINRLEAQALVDLQAGADPNAFGCMDDHTGQVAGYHWIWRPPFWALSSHSSICGTALMAAACANRCKLVRALLERGADPNRTGVFGFTALHVAAAYASPEVVKLLVEHGADIHIQSENHEAPLVIASAWANGIQLENARLLIRLGSDVNARDHDGNILLKRLGIGVDVDDDYRKLKKDLIQAGAHE